MSVKFIPTPPLLSVNDASIHFEKDKTKTRTHQGKVYYYYAKKTEKNDKTKLVFQIIGKVLLGILGFGIPWSAASFRNWIKVSQTALKIGNEVTKYYVLASDNIKLASDNSEVIKTNESASAILKDFENKGYTNPETGLFHAVANGNLNEVKDVLAYATEKQLIFNTCQPLRTAIADNSLEVIKLLLQKYDQKQLDELVLDFYSNLLLGDNEGMRLFLKTYFDSQPFHRFISQNNAVAIEKIKKLIGINALNIIPHLLDTLLGLDANGQSPYHLAAMSGDSGTFETLLIKNYEAAPLASDKTGKTPFCYALDNQPLLDKLHECYGDFGPVGKVNTKDLQHFFEKFPEESVGKYYITDFHCRKLFETVLANNDYQTAEWLYKYKKFCLSREFFDNVTKFESKTILFLMYERPFSEYSFNPRSWLVKQEFPADLFETTWKSKSIGEIVLEHFHNSTPKEYIDFNWPDIEKFLLKYPEDKLKSIFAKEDDKGSTLLHKIASNYNKFSKLLNFAEKRAIQNVFFTKTDAEGWTPFHRVLASKGFSSLKPKEKQKFCEHLAKLSEPLSFDWFKNTPANFPKDNLVFGVLLKFIGKKLSENALDISELENIYNISPQLFNTYFTEMPSPLLLGVMSSNKILIEFSIGKCEKENLKEIMLTKGSKFLLGPILATIVSETTIEEKLQLLQYLKEKLPQEMLAVGFEARCPLLGRTALHYAATLDIELVKFVLENCSNMHAIFTLISLLDETVLECAADTNKPEIIDMLFKHCPADHIAKFFEDKALKRAIRHGNLATAKAILAHFPDPEKIFATENNPFADAIESGLEDALKEVYAMCPEPHRPNLFNKGSYDAICKNWNLLNLFLSYIPADSEVKCHIELAKCLEKKGQYLQLTDLFKRMMNSDKSLLYIEEICKVPGLAFQFLKENDALIKDYINKAKQENKALPAFILANLPCFPPEEIYGAVQSIDSLQGDSLLHAVIKVEQDVHMPIDHALKAIKEHIVNHIPWDSSGNLMQQEATAFLKKIPLSTLAYAARMPDLQDTVLAYARLFTDAQAQVVLPQISPPKLIKLLQEDLNNYIEHARLLPFCLLEQKTAYASTNFVQLVVPGYNQSLVKFENEMDAINLMVKSPERDAKIKDLKLFVDAFVHKFLLMDGLIFQLNKIGAHLCCNIQDDSFKKQVTEKIETSKQLLVSVQAKAKKIQATANACELYSSDVTPEEFLDAITCEIMTDPVTLPGTGGAQKTIDSSTLKALGDGTQFKHPYTNKMHLVTEVTKNDALKAKIEAWKNGQ